MVNYYRNIKKISFILFCLVILVIIIFGLFSYSTTFKELNNNDRIIKREFYRQLNEIYFLEDVDSLTEEQWDSICLAVNICCFILDNFEFDILYENNEEIKSNNIGSSINNYFHDLNDNLSNVSFYNLTSDQKNYFILVGHQIHCALGDDSNSFFPSLYSYIA